MRTRSNRLAWLVVVVFLCLIEAAIILKINHVGEYNRIYPKVKVYQVSEYKGYRHSRLVYTDHGVFILPNSLNLGFNIEAKSIYAFVVHETGTLIPKHTIIDGMILIQNGVPYPKIPVPDIMKKGDILNNNDSR